MEPAEGVLQSNSPSTHSFRFTSPSVQYILNILYIRRVEDGHHPHRPSNRNMRKFFYKFTATAAVAFLLAFFTAFAGGCRLGVPAKISMLATVMALVTALFGMAVELRGEGELSRAVHVIDAAVTVSSIVAFTALSWMLLDGGYRWIACLVGVFLSIFIFHRPFLGWFGHLANRLGWGSRAGHGSILPR